MRIGRDTTYAFVAQGRIPSVKLGKQIRIPRAALLAHLEKEALRPPIDERRPAAGADLKVTSARLGHSSISLTADLYTHVASEMDHRAAKGLDVHLAPYLGGSV